MINTILDLCGFRVNIALYERVLFVTFKFMELIVCFEYIIVCVLFTNCMMLRSRRNSVIMYY